MKIPKTQQEIIQRRMHARGIKSLDELAKLAEITIEQINDWDDSPQFLKALSKALNCSIEYLWTGKETAGDRIKWRRELLGIKTQSELARKAGIAAQNVQLLEANEIENSRHLKDIAEALETTVDYLITGIMPNLVIASDFQGAEGTIPLHTVRTVPLLEWQEIKIWTEGNMMPARKIESVPLRFKGSRQTFAIKVLDDSMISHIANTDSFRIGDLLCFDPQKEAKHGSYVLVECSHSSEYLFRKLVNIAGKQYLQPLNPTYPHQPADGVKIIAALVETTRAFD